MREILKGGVGTKDQSVTFLETGGFVSLLSPASAAAAARLREQKRERRLPPALSFFLATPASLSYSFRQSVFLIPLSNYALRVISLFW